METPALFFIFLISSCVCFCAGQLSSNKLCTDQINYDACQQIARDPDMTCQYVISKSDCILDADSGKPILSALEPEEAFLGAAKATGKAVVIGEILSANPPYRAAVIVKSEHIGGFESLRGYKFCHPGYDHDERITKLVLEQLDWQLLKLPCDSSKTLTEQKFEALSLTFGSSCRPGKWTEDGELDAKLKSDYSSLCKLCGAEGCSTKYKTPLNDTLSCLTDNGGDIAMTALHYAEAFFQNRSNAQTYAYLCPNGTVAPWNKPCTWTNQLNRLLLTSSDSASTMSNYLANKLPSYMKKGAISGSTSSYSAPIERNLALLLKLSSIDKINVINPASLHDYVSERRSIPVASQSIRCGLPLKWTVTNELELGKCSWLQQASLNYGLQPVILCVSSNGTTLSNLDNINQGTADLAFVDANFGYVARKKNLVNVAYTETDLRQISKIVIVVRSDTDWYNGLKSFKGKRICLPEYGGKEWLAFVDLLSTYRIIQDCDYGRAFSGFVGPSCAPGAKVEELDIPNTDKERLCENCYPVTDTTTHKYCNADPVNKYYDSLGALKCLNETNGDYAVIALSDLPFEYQTNIQEHQRFSVISKNGSRASYNGFEVDEEAFISVIVAGEVLVKNGTPKYNDIVLYLREVEEEFGLNAFKPFKVFDSFNRTRNLLFPDSTPGLTFGGSQNKFIQNYVSLLQRTDKTCTSPPSSSDKNTVQLIWTVFLIAALIIILIIFVIYSVMKNKKQAQQEEGTNRGNSQGLLTDN